MSDRRTTEEQLRILRFWWLLELFSPQKVPNPAANTSRSPDERVISWKPNDPLPWETLEPATPHDQGEKVWSHTVYLGVYSVSDIYDSLHNVFHDDADSYEERSSGLSACAGLVVDHRGQLVAESQLLSSALWATGRAEKFGTRNPRWAEGFDHERDSFTETVEKLEAQRIETIRKAKELRSSRRSTAEEPNDEASANNTGTNQETPPPPIDGIFLKKLLETAHHRSGVKGHQQLATDSIVIKSSKISSKRANESPESDFLNSFFLDDLARVRDQVAQGEMGDSLAEYLTPDSALLPMRNRIDVGESKSLVNAEASIGHLPKARWPSDPQHHLALSQQFAVNRALGSFASSRGIMGVNGPPGTGKTTMLRDVLAGNVVERARRLAALTRAADAFTGKVHKWNSSGTYDAKVPQLRPELTGFEMIVASANNAAVENISMEIPGAEAICDQWREEADYFRDVATFVRRGNSKRKPTEDGNAAEAWGTIAARLGKKSNRKEFRSTYWFRETDPVTKKPIEGGSPGMQATLRSWLAQKAERPTWDEARNSFIQAENKVDQLIDERSAAKERKDRLDDVRDRAKETQSRLEVLDGQIGLVQEDFEHCLAEERAAGKRRDNVCVEYDRHVQAKPGLWETMSTFGRVLKPWRTQMNEQMQRLGVAEAELRQKTEEKESCQLAFHEKAEERSHAESDCRGAQDALNALSTKCKHDADKFGSAYPGDKWTGDNRELCAPWLDEEIDRARSELFFAALKLHQDFFVAAGGQFLDGLRSAVDVVGAEHPPKLEAEKLLAAWQLFFLAVPLVSTSFASAGRMLGNLGTSSIGWLFIDEAGQAPPQYAVGSIWRAQRVLAIGDPLQLQPVVTIPSKAKRDIASTLGVSTDWHPPEASVQTLADRVSSFGTVLTQDGHDVWVSAPLRVHRRCDNPMFTICNDLAYNGIMVNGINRSPDDADLFGSFTDHQIYPSFWADTPATQSGTHLQTNQIERLRRAIDHLGENGVDPSDIIAISPFRPVADHLRSLKSQYPGLTAGTIHTAQGKEAPVVFFVLGGDPSKPGAKSWAASSVNLVNVAVSRAQRRIYVIGDKEAWSKHDYFRQLSHNLDDHLDRWKASRSVS